MFLGVTVTLVGMDSSDLLMQDGAPTRAGIAKIVTEARLARHWGKEEAARRAGMSSITWKRVEDGENVQDASLAKVLGALDLTMELIAEALTKGEDGRFAYYAGVVDRAFEEAVGPLSEHMARHHGRISESVEVLGADVVATKMFQVKDGVAAALDLAELAIDIGTPRSDVGRLIAGLTAIYFGSGAFTIVHSGDEKEANDVAERIARLRSENSKRPAGPGFLETMANALGSAVYHQLGGDGDPYLDPAEPGDASNVHPLRHRDTSRTTRAVANEDETLEHIVEAQQDEP